MTHFEEYLEVFEAIGDAEGIAHAKASIAIAKSMYEGGSNEEVLEASQELYELRVAELGEKNEYTILAGQNYAIHLQSFQWHWLLGLMHRPSFSGPAIRPTPSN